MLEDLSSEFAEQALTLASLDLPHEHSKVRALDLHAVAGELALECGGCNLAALKLSDRVTELLLLRRFKFTGRLDSCTLPPVEGLGRSVVWYGCAGASRLVLDLILADVECLVDSLAARRLAFFRF